MRVLPTLWTGFRLRCPSCRHGRIYHGFRANSSCSSCGVEFQSSDEGHFLVTVVAAYSITAVLLAAFVFALNVVYPEMTILLQIVICLLFASVFLLLSYRHFKGVSVALIHLTFGLRPRPTTATAQDEQNIATKGDRR